jgi:amidohydrolase
MLKAKAFQAIDAYKEEIIEIAKKIHENPELGHQEFKAVKLLTETIKKHGFHVTTRISGLATSFKAELPGGNEPVVAILAEYDALPGIGHACGHNLIAAAALGAALGFKAVSCQVNGTIILYGTPAEEGVVENAGGKVLMIEEISKADAVIMVHPGSNWRSYSTNLARESFLVEFHGKASHAGGSPEKGVNALEGILQTFNGINALRQHLRSDIRIHGIIKHGGDSPNVVPHYASAHLYVRAPNMPLLKETFEKVENIVKGAALMTGTNTEITRIANTYANRIPSKVLSDLYRVNLALNGIQVPDEQLREGGGSTDFGNISQVVPGLSGYFDVGSAPLHSPEGAFACASPKSFESAIIAAKTLAGVAIDLLTDPEKISEAKREHKRLIEDQAKSL